MSLRNRLKSLEQIQRDDFAIRLLSVNEAGLVLDDGSDPIRPWIGRHYSAVPDNCKVIVGVDPLVMLGRRPAGAESREGAP